MVIFVFAYIIPVSEGLTNYWRRFVCICFKIPLKKNRNIGAQKLLLSSSGMI
ncbi:hypothetical protein M23134_04534 [Microscilla marina ATCC 23134]|uniref:Uncharacterized protein n=1 Tax=Microscilla marina ATCC 23134 TaxID=313606 RepID=A1ZWB5_MICM2|nr:hypothetical protein M23134_04534 [Microscilla marina ATCC 23134]